MLLDEVNDETIFSYTQAGIEICVQSRYLLDHGGATETKESGTG